MNANERILIGLALALVLGIGIVSLYQFLPTGITFLMFLACIGSCYYIGTGIRERISTKPKFKLK